MKSIFLLVSLMTAQFAVAGTFEILINPSSDLECYTTISKFKNPDGEPNLPISRARLRIRHVPEAIVFTDETILYAEDVGPDCRSFEGLGNGELKTTLTVEEIDMINESNGRHYIYESIKAVIHGKSAFIFSAGGNDGKF